MGILVVAALSNQDLLCVLSQLMNYVGALWGNPPATGARIITSILCNPALFGEWYGVGRSGQGKVLGLLQADRLRDSLGSFIYFVVSLSHSFVHTFIKFH